MGKGIRGRLLSSYLILMALFLAVLGSGLLAGLEWYYRSAITDVLSLRARSDQQFLAQILQGIDLTVAGQDLSRELGAGLPARVQLYRADGALVGDSSLPSAPGPQAPRAAELPEVAVALRQRLQAEELTRESGERVLHLAIHLPGPDGAVGALRYSTSLAAVDRLLVQAVQVVGLLSLAVLAVTALVGLLLARSLVQPLTELTQVAEAIGSGDLGLRARVHLPDEVGRLAQTLNRMAESLGELDRLRSDFLRAISHDLRTPLAAIKAWAVTLQDEGVPPDELKLGLATVERSTDHLARLVEDLLVTARLQSGGQISLHPRPFDPGEAALALCQAMASRAREAGVTLEPPAEAEGPPVWFDPDRFTQIVANLVENAIKFTPRGGRVSLALAAVAGEVRLTVTDTGVGIAPADLPRLTEPFYRGRTPRPVPGSGLGLSIVSELLRLGGGRLAIESKEGEGTRVMLYLPQAERGRI